MACRSIRSYIIESAGIEHPLSTMLEYLLGTDLQQRAALNQCVRELPKDRAARLFQYLHQHTINISAPGGLVEEVPQILLLLDEGLHDLRDLLDCV